MRMTGMVFGLFAVQSLKQTTMATLHVSQWEKNYVLIERAQSVESKTDGE
jgi:hypothetical protein